VLMSGTLEAPSPVRFTLGDCVRSGGKFMDLDIALTHIDGIVPRLEARILISRSRPVASPNTRSSCIGSNVVYGA